MRFVVCVDRGGVESTLGPFNLETAKERVRELACEPANRERFCAYVVPLPDDGQPDNAPTGLDG
jgi:hypothetical protein